MRIDIYDAIYFVGVTMVAAGAYMIFKPAALVVGGLALVYVGIAGHSEPEK